jgi:hypothetical protein
MNCLSYKTTLVELRLSDAMHWMLIASFFSMLTTATANFASRIEVSSRCMITFLISSAPSHCKEDLSLSMLINFCNAQKFLRQKALYMQKASLKIRYIYAHVLCCREDDDTLFAHCSFSRSLSSHSQRLTEAKHALGLLWEAVCHSTRATLTHSVCVLSS